MKKLEGIEINGKKYIYNDIKKKRVKIGKNG